MKAFSGHPVVLLNDLSQIGAVRRFTRQLAQHAGLGETEQGRAAIVANELATNLVRHARGGEMLLRPVSSGFGAGIEIIALDRGPGMLDLRRCLSDGFSTGGTAGNGLGAVRRLSGEFDAYSTRPGGTVVLSRVYGAAAPAKRTDGRFQLGIVAVPYPGEPQSGDGWHEAHTDGLEAVMVVDGLGHGPEAARAAHTALAVFAARPFQEPERLLMLAHDSLHATRGAAIAAALIDLNKGTMRYAGIGNISGTLLRADGSHSLMSHNGTVGFQFRKVQTLEYPWMASDLLIMHSDGVNTRWNLDAYAGLARCHPAVIAGVLYRDFKRERDDTTILVARASPSAL